MLTEIFHEAEMRMAYLNVSVYKVGMGLLARAPSFVFQFPR